MNRRAPAVGRGPCGAESAYQACVRVQWGQPTEVVTSASKAYPHSHVYSARSSEGPPWRRSAEAPTVASLCVEELKRASAAWPSRARRRHRALLSFCFDLTNISSNNSSGSDWFLY